MVLLSRSQYTGKRHLFPGHDDSDVVVGIVDLLGTAGLHAYLGKYNLTLPDSFQAALGDEYVHCGVMGCGLLHP